MSEERELRERSRGRTGRRVESVVRERVEELVRTTTRVPEIARATSMKVNRLVNTYKRGDLEVIP